jgi:uncharacterized membrane protein YeaQ/YmgE (transglycosylase-associated protein family)
MGIISWLVVGLIAGFIGSKIVNKTGEGLIRDIILGIIGAFVGGWISPLWVRPALPVLTSTAFLPR